MKRRVVVTGAGAFSAIGIGVEKFWRQCLESRSVVLPIPPRWTQYADLSSRLWSPLPEPDVEAYGISKLERLQFDPVTIQTLYAAREALICAGILLSSIGINQGTYTLHGVDPTRVGIYLGTGIGGAFSFLDNHCYHLFQRTRAALQTYIKECTVAANRAKLEDILARMNHGRRYHPFVVSLLMPNAISAAVGIKFSLTGPNETYCVACAAGTVAIGNAYRAVREGRVDIALCGGSEHLYDEHGHIFRGFDVAGTLVRDCADPERANRPFDKKRSGFLFSQGGAAILVLEELTHALRRGAKPIAEIIGFAETFDAHSIMALAPDGAQIERMIRMALAEAGVKPQEVDYINAHGTGTQNNDAIEAEVIERVFGRRPLVNTTKSLLGHTIGASGAFEVLVTALSLRDGVTHVCKNLEDPVRDLNFVRRVESHDLRIGLSQSFAFGGHNAAVVLRRFEAQA